MGGREMTNEQINIAIEKNIRPALHGNIYRPTRDFCNDLNAMHEAERTSTIFKSWRATKTWMDNLCICSDLGRLPESAPDWAFVLQATAAQRAEAFLKTIGEWEE